ncbi:hypothetical protein Rsub_07253 [Raphidocelis subcapitata]|uniref:UVR domain-containing protein n=1 Tax=Raphidocelis subcapitata TaxID=307507 RepID=A0A2V0P4E0_9CHLO|nr:hypothetical protein Rsub_07253 [Raphidocelis subcapitata]|eukprot:GBF94439.1 hypothetical protein Rsub_07253 [Raphidocelis subcapitata]
MAATLAHLTRRAPAADAVRGAARRGPPAAARAPTRRGGHPCRGGACSSTANPDGPGPSALRTAEEVGQVWEQLTHMKRKLNQAIAQENFSAAALLRDQVKALSDSLPPVQQFEYAQLERLRSGSVEERRAAISALGAAGDDACLPDLALCLRDPSTRDAAHSAMWSVFGRCGDVRVRELMGEAEPLLHANSEPQLARALALYDQVVALAPSFSEGFNKRATVLYLLHRYEDAVADCERVLDLNPYHFGAASGMGLCLWSLKRTQQALAAFERALEIHPGLTVIRRHTETLRDEMDAAGPAPS